MSSISAIDSEAITELPTTINEDENKEPSESVVTPQQETKPGESEARMKAEETILRETSSNLKNLGRMGESGQIENALKELKKIMEIQV